MEEEPIYSLLQAIDPSKIKVPINERKYNWNFITKTKIKTFYL